VRRAHWREAAIDGLLLGIFMISAGLFGTLLFAPLSPAAPLLAALSASTRAVLMGLAMGATALALIQSPLGQRSGAHMNPAITFAYLRLGKMERRDAVAYWIAQPIGGVLGVVAVTLAWGEPFTAVPVRSVATVPGPWGWAAAFAAEALMAFVLFSVVLILSNHVRWRRFTGLAAAALVAAYIAVEAPVSGMSLNPARSFASALPSGIWTGFWIYLAAPTLGILAATELYTQRRGVGAVVCAKLHHTDRHDCIFRCGWCRHSTATPSIEGPH
jgi:aquaporin Z